MLAIRPKTLPAAVVPVVVGAAVAGAAGKFVLMPMLAALLGAILIQIGTNFANDYYDFKSGADNEDRLGPTRVTQAGLIDATTVRNAMVGTFALSALVGVYLVMVGGWPILVLGVLSIMSGVAYTGGPYPLGYHGLGDLFVFLFFGIAAVCGTYWVQAVEWSWVAFAASIPVGLLSVAILVVNNVRDIDTDRVAGKNTLAVRLGERRGRAQWYACVIGAFLMPVAQVAAGGSPWLMLSWLSLPVAVAVGRKFAAATGGALNPVLGATGKLLTVYGLLYALGFSLSAL